MVPSFTSYLENDADAMNYQGWSLTRVYVEELTSTREFCWYLQVVRHAEDHERRALDFAPPAIREAQGTIG